MARFAADNFEATHQKVGTFRVVNGVKQGGNVASYVCLNDGTVIHAIAGPLAPAQYLRELRWAVDMRKLATAQAGGDAIKYRETVRKGHTERLVRESGVRHPEHALPELTDSAPPVPAPAELRGRNGGALGNQGQVHAILAAAPVPKLSQLYPIVFEKILGEKVSTLPVETK